MVILNLGIMWKIIYTRTFFPKYTLWPLPQAEFFLWMSFSINFHTFFHQNRNFNFFPHTLRPLSIGGGVIPPQMVRTKVGLGVLLYWFSYLTPISVLLLIFLYNCPIQMLHPLPPEKEKFKEFEVLHGLIKKLPLSILRS